MRQDRNALCYYHYFKSWCQPQRARNMICTQRTELEFLTLRFIRYYALKGLWHASAHVRQLDFYSGGQFFKIDVLVKKSSSIDPETPDKAIISVFKSYLVHLGSFKRHILYFCASIVEKIRSHWGEPYEAKFVVVSVPTNGSNVAFNVVIWLSFLSINVLQSTIYLWRIFFKR